MFIREECLAFRTFIRKFVHFFSFSGKKGNNEEQLLFESGSSSQKIHLSVFAYAMFYYIVKKFRFRCCCRYCINFVFFRNFCVCVRVRRAQHKWICKWVERCKSNDKRNMRGGKAKKKKRKKPTIFPYAKIPCCATTV